MCRTIPETLQVRSITKCSYLVVEVNYLYLSGNTAPSFGSLLFLNRDVGFSNCTSLIILFSTESRPLMSILISSTAPSVCIHDVYYRGREDAPHTTKKRFFSIMWKYFPNMKPSSFLKNEDLSFWETDGVIWYRKYPLLTYVAKFACW